MKPKFLNTNQQEAPQPNLFTPFKPHFVPRRFIRDLHLWDKGGRIKIGQSEKLNLDTTRSNKASVNLGGGVRGWGTTWSNSCWLAPSFIKLKWKKLLWTHLYRSLDASVSRKGMILSETTLQLRQTLVSGTTPQNKSIRHRQMFLALQSDWSKDQEENYISTEILE